MSRSPSLKASAPNGAAPEIQTQSLSKTFSERSVLDGIDLTINAGDILCIVGGSGSGKTVLLDHLAGLMQPTSGRVLAADHNSPPDAHGRAPLVDLAQLSPDRLDLLRLHWAVVFQRNALFSGSVRDNIALWLREHTRLDDAQIDQRIRESLKAAALDVDDVIDKDREALSGGMAKRVAIARAIACEPLVLFYDEPTTGLDPVVGGAIHELLWNMHHRPLGEGLPLRDVDAADTSAVQRAPHAGRTSIIVTHDRDLLRRMAPRVVMLHEARIAFDGPYAEFERSDAEPARAYLARMPTLHATRYRLAPDGPGRTSPRPK